MPRSLGSFAFAATGVGLAATAILFAVYMVSDRNRTPTFSGAEHLMIFARPASHDPGKLQARRNSGAPSAQIDADDMPVGSITPRDAGSEVGLPGEKASNGGLQSGKRRTETPVRGIFNGKALVEVPNGFALVEPGSYLPSLGHVLAIEARDGKWVLVTTHTVVSADR